MDDMTPFEERLAARLRVDAARGTTGVSAAVTADEVLRVARTRHRFGYGIGRSRTARRWIVVGLTAGLIILGLIAASVIGSRPPRSFPSGLIAYSGGATGSVWAMPGSGGQPRLLVDQSRLGPLTWSPDGRWLAAMTRDLRVLFARPDGTDTRVIGRGHDIDWSRDGRRIAMIEPTRSGGLPAIRDLASGKDDMFSLPAGFTSAQLVGWLGDDRHILIRACTGCGTGAVHRYAWYLLPGEQRLDLPPTVQPGSISPDGWSMAWSPCSSDVGVGPCPGLFLSDLRTGATRQIGDPLADAYDRMSWAPDGSWIVYPSGPVAEFGTATGIWKASMDGTRPVQLLDQSAEIAVSPDGASIAFVKTDEGPDRSLFLLSPDGSKTTELVRGAGGGWLAWQPALGTADSPEDPAVDPTVKTCDPEPVFRTQGCVVVQSSGVIVPLDVDPEVDPINVLDLNLDKRTQVGPGVLSAIHDASIVALAATASCDRAAFSDGAVAQPPGSSRDVETGRWCVRTKAGSVVELSLIGFDADYGTLLAYQRKS